MTSDTEFLAIWDRENLINQVAELTGLYPGFLRIIGCKADQSIAEEMKQNILALKAMVKMVEPLQKEGNTSALNLENFVIAFAELEKIVGDWKVTAPIKGQILAQFLDKVNPALAQAKSGVMTPKQLADDKKTEELLYLMDKAGKSIGRYLSLGEYAEGGTRTRGALSYLTPEEAAKNIKEDLENNRSVGMWKIAYEMVQINRKTIDADLQTALDKYLESLNYLAGDYRDALAKRMKGPLRKLAGTNWVTTAAVGLGAYGAGAGEGDMGKDAAGGVKPLHDSLEAAVDYVIKRLIDEKHFEITDVLTRPQAAALVAYTSQLYGNVNIGLRVGGAVTSTNLQRWTALAVSGLLKLPSMHGTAYRHDSINPFTLGRLQKREFSDIAFFSAAQNIKGTGGAADHDMLSVLKYHRGTDVAQLSYYGVVEAEVLFPPSTRWRVDNVYRRDDFKFDAKGIPIPWVQANPKDIGQLFNDIHVSELGNWTPNLPVDIKSLMKDTSHGKRWKVQVIVVATQL